MLVRLYDKHGLRDIALEGYLKESPKIDPAWYRNAAPGSSPIILAGAAVRLLREGEISAAEFMGLVFEDVKIHPAEDEASYRAAFRNGALDAMMKLAGRIGPDTARAVDERIQAAINGKSFSTKQQLEFAEEMERQRAKLNIDLAPAELEDWSSWLNFWKARARADSTMVEATTSIAGTPRIAAMIIGSAHTPEVLRLLSVAERPHAVLTPGVIKDRDKRGDLEDNYTRKTEKKSVFSSGYFAAQINQIGGIKPEPATAKPETWIAAKAAVYRTIDVIASAALGDGGKGGGTTPPFGLDQNGFQSPYARPVLAKASIVDGDDDSKRAVVFPIILNPDAPSNRRTIWVKAVLNQGHENGIGAIEEMLKQAFSELQANPKDSNQTEDLRGRIQISPGTFAGFAGSEAAARALRINS